MVEGYRVYFSGNCNRVEGMKRQHKVGLVVKEENVLKYGKDGIMIECISVRLLKARISNKSSSVTFYAPTESNAEGGKVDTCRPFIAPWHLCPCGNQGRE